MLPAVASIWCRIRRAHFGNSTRCSATSRARCAPSRPRRTCAPRNGNYVARRAFSAAIRSRLGDRANFFVDECRSVDVRCSRKLKRAWTPADEAFRMSGERGVERDLAGCNPLSCSPVMNVCGRQERDSAVTMLVIVPAKERRRKTLVLLRCL
jgi:hypothetical protein